MDGLKELKTLKFEAIRKKFPNCPDHAIPKPKYSDKTSNGLTRAIIDFLNLKGWQAERVSNTGRRIDQRQKVVDAIGKTQIIGSVKWIKGSGRNGTADIAATIDGNSVKIEVKKGSDKQSNEQKQYQKEVEAAGGIYFIARDFKSFYKWYCQTFEKEKAPHTGQ